MMLEITSFSGPLTSRPACIAPRRSAVRIRLAPFDEVAARGRFRSSEPFPTAAELALHFGHECPKWRRYEGIGADCRRFLACIWPPAELGAHKFAPIKYETALRPEPVGGFRSSDRLPSRCGPSGGYRYRSRIRPAGSP